MKYRVLPGEGGSVSALGMGCMRLPVLEQEGKPIDREKAIELIRHLIDGGVSYIDTAYVYHDQKSEGLVGEALKDGYRERVTLATKLPSWLVESPADMERLLDEQLERLGVDHIDVYLVHALDAKQFKRLEEMGLFVFLDKMVWKGKIRYPGFSFHDDAEAFRMIVDSYPWDVAQVQMNYLDEFNQATMDGVRYAASKGIKIVVMEPLRGGQLVKTVPDEVRELYEETAPGRNPAEWAFRWLIDKPEFMTILSGMTTMEQADDNLRIFSEADVGCMTEEEIETIEDARSAYEARIRVGCTGCGYCQPCPKGVKIPNIFRSYDEAAMFDDFDRFHKRYEHMEIKADACVHCGACVKVCPQHFAVPIPDMLAAIHAEHREIIPEPVKEEEKPAADTSAEEMPVEEVAEEESIAEKIKFDDCDVLLGALEAGGTKMVCAVGNAQGRIYVRESFPTQDPTRTLKAIVGFFQRYEIAALGIGSFGPLNLDKNDPAYGSITTTPKPGWQNVPLAKELEEKLGVPVAIDTDVNAAALGEARLGAGQGLDSLVYYTIGTGVGGGALADGKLLHGMVHPEMGHMLLRPDPRDPMPRGVCPYHDGCLEGLASGPSVEKRWGKSAKLLGEEHVAWDVEAEYLAQMCVNTIVTLSPKKIVLGGGIMHQLHLFPRIRKRVLTLLNGYVSAPAILEHIDEYIVPPALGDNAGAVGSLLLAVDALEKND